VWIPLRVAADGRFEGHDGVRRFFALNRENFSSFGFDTREITALDDTRVLYDGDVVVEGRESGAVVSQPNASLIEVRDGLATRVEAFGERERAVAAYEAGWPS
jgi:ketosteroid isomerase-like protein